MHNDKAEGTCKEVGKLLSIYDNIYFSNNNKILYLNRGPVIYLTTLVSR